MSQEERDLDAELILWSRGFAIPRHWVWPLGLSSPDLQDNGMRWPKSEPKWGPMMARCVVTEGGFLEIHRHFPSFPKGFSKNFKLVILLGDKKEIGFFLVFFFFRL